MELSGQVIEISLAFFHFFEFNNFLFIFGRKFSFFTIKTYSPHQARTFFVYIITKHISRHKQNSIKVFSLTTWSFYFDKRKLNNWRVLYILELLKFSFYTSIRALAHNWIFFNFLNPVLNASIALISVRGDEVKLYNNTHAYWWLHDDMRLIEE